LVHTFWPGKTFSKSAGVLPMQCGHVGSPTESLATRTALNTPPQPRQRTSSPTDHLRSGLCSFSQLHTFKPHLQNRCLILAHGFFEKGIRFTPWCSQGLRRMMFG
jgi:hypothetical protein